MHTPLSIGINLGTLSPVHRESKPTQWFEESTRTFTRCISTTLVLICSAILISETQTSENTSIVKLLILKIFLMMIFLLLFIKVNTLTHLILSLALYLIHTYLLPVMYLFFSLHSYSVLKSVLEAMSIPSWKGAMKEMLALEQNET